MNCCVPFNYVFIESRSQTKSMNHFNASIASADYLSSTVRLKDVIQKEIYRFILTRFFKFKHIQY